MSYRQELSFGLDIGDRSLKVLQLRLRHAIPTVAGFSELEIPPGLVSSGEILREGELVNAIKTVLKKSRIAARRVVIALPETKTFLKIIDVPLMTALPLAALTEAEMEKHLPFENNEVWWDFMPLRTFDTHVQVLLGASPRPLVNSYSRLCVQSGLTPIILDLEPLAIARGIMDGKASVGCQLICDLGATKSTLIVATDSAVVATADGRLSADKLTESLATGLKVDKNAAEEIKKKYGVSEGPPPYLDIVKDYCALLLRRMRDIIDHAHNESACPSFTEIILTGGGALLKGLPELLTTALKLPVRLGQPGLNRAAKSAQFFQGQTGIRFVTAYGLARAALEFDQTN